MFAHALHASAIENITSYLHIAAALSERDGRDVGGTVTLNKRRWRSADRHRTFCWVCSWMALW